MLAKLKTLIYAGLFVSNSFKLEIYVCVSSAIPYCFEATTPSLKVLKRRLFTSDNSVSLKEAGRTVLGQSRLWMNVI